MTQSVKCSASLRIRIKLIGIRDSFQYQVVQSETDLILAFDRASDTLNSRLVSKNRN